MTVILVLSVFVVFLTIDYFMPKVKNAAYVLRGTMHTTQGFEMLGALAQDGGEKIAEIENDYEI
jgi:hypothetical protein